MSQIAATVALKMAACSLTNQNKSPRQQSMTMNKFSRLSTVVLLAIILPGAWYSVASNYDYGALSGTYNLDRDGIRCTLHLRSDQTFLEELTVAGSVQKATGQWYRYGEAHVSFSSAFMKMPGQELNAPGEAHGQFNKTLGLFPSLTLAPLPDGPTFRKQLFR